MFVSVCVSEREVIGMDEKERDERECEIEIERGEN